MSEAPLVARAARRTLEGVEAAEVVGAGCAWTFAFAGPFATGFLLALVWPWVGGAVGAMSLLGAWLLRRIAQARTDRARPLLDGLEDASYPTWSVPIRVPRAFRTEGGRRRIWRVHGVRPNGRRVTAEVVVEGENGCWFVVWPVSMARPRETRGFEMVLEPVLGGYLVASPEPAHTAVRLRDPVVRQILGELLSEHDELSVYPFSTWWRSRGEVDRARLRGMEVRLVQLLDVLTPG